MPEPVGRRLRGHAAAPRQPAGAADPPSGHAHRAHLHQRLLDTGPAPPVAFDRRRLEQGAPGFGHPRPAPAAAGPERLRSPVRSYLAALAISSARSVGHRVGGILDPRPDHGVELGLEHGVVELHVFPGHSLAPLSDCGFPVRRLRIVHGTGHVLFQEARITKRAEIRSLSAGSDASDVSTTS